MTHYEERLDKDLTDIRAQIAEMAGLVDTAVKDAMHALQTGNTKLAAATVLNDHPINRMMRKIDAMCHKFIALHLPSAGHLRLLSSVIRANIELERIGDYAVTICRKALQLSTPPHGHLATELERVGSETQSMLQSAIEAFNELNAEKARTIMMLEEHMENNLDIVYAELAANDEQDAVKMIHLVLQGAGLEPLHLIVTALAFRVLSRELDTFGADHIAGVIGNRETTFPPHLESLPPGDLRVYQHQMPVIGDRLARIGDIDDDDPVKPSHLGGRDTHGPGPGLTGFFQIFYEPLQRLIKLLDGQGDLLEPRIRYFQDLQYSHMGIQPIRVSIGAILTSISPRSLSAPCSVSRVASA